MPGNKSGASHQQLKIDNAINNNNNRSLIIGFPICGKTYLINYILIEKLERTYTISKSLNQYLNNKTHTLDEIQLSENYENSTVVFEDMLLSKQACKCYLFFARGRNSNIEIYYKLQIYITCQRNLIVIIRKYQFVLSKLNGISYYYLML